jgi:tetraacyldisaccharide 4'-kinase
MSFIEKYWYRSSLNVMTLFLLPLSWLFLLIVRLRYHLYQIGVMKSTQVSVPIIVVGNITVGGTGKTPCVIWLVQFLKQHGYNPGIISRGVGGKKNKTPVWVDNHTHVKDVGDEAILFMRKAICPIVVCIDRVKAAKLLIKHSTCDVIVSDDGLQHYALKRDMEIIMIDGLRQFGNRQLLPAGPLREPLSRLKRATFMITNVNALTAKYQMAYVGDEVISVKTGARKSLSEFRHSHVHLVTAIGNPQRFYQTCLAFELKIIKHFFTDHYLFREKDFQFNNNLPIIMTEKDVVKCYHFADERFWYLPTEVQMDTYFETQLVKQLQHLKAKQYE